MKKAFLPGLVAAALLFSCIPAGDAPQYQIPSQTNVCSQVSIQNAHITSDAEFMDLVQCLNDTGSLDPIIPMVDDLATSTNPDTGKPYLDDLVAITNGVLGDPDFGKLVQVASVLVHENAIGDVLPVGSTLIDSGLAKQLLPVVKQSIDSGAAAESLPAVSALLRYPQMPVLLASVKTLIDNSISEGWGQPGINDIATLLTVTDPAGKPALEDALPPLNTFLTSGQAGNLVPVMNQLFQSGTVDQLVGVVGTLSSSGVLAQMGPDLAPMMVPNAQGNTELEGTLNILAATNGPLSCFGVQLVPNLAQSILSTMADETPATVQNLVSVLEATIGLAGLACDIPPAVQTNLSSLNALAQSGALDGMLPILKVFKNQNQVPLLCNLMVSLQQSDALPALEPMLLAGINAGMMSHMAQTIPNLINPNGTATPELAAILAATANLVAPTDPSDPSTAPAVKLLPLLGAAGAVSAQTTAQALFLLGQTMQNPQSGFANLMPAVSAALGADPQGEVLLAIADRIDDGTIGNGLPMTSQLIGSGSVDALLPWGSQLIHNGTAASLLQLLSQAFALMQTS